LPEFATIDGWDRSSVNVRPSASRRRMPLAQLHGTRRVPQRRHRRGLPTRTIAGVRRGCRYFVSIVTDHAPPFRAQRTLIRKRSLVRVQDRPSRLPGLEPGPPLALRAR
jgi:hypothetical protein